MVPESLRERLEGHAIRRLILHSLWLAPLAALFLWQVSPIAAVATVMLSHALVLYPTLRPTSQWLGPVATSFRAAGRQVWLTIDDGPSDQTLRLLDVLDRYSAKATFFVIGRRADEHREVLAEIARRGHTLGNHSHTHPSASFWALGPRRIDEEIDRCNQVLEAAARSKPRWFRAPVGMKNPFVHPIARRHHLQVVAWSARGYDAVADDPDYILRRILGRVRPGAILLLHEGREMNVVLIEKLLEQLANSGYSCVIPEEGQLLPSSSSSRSDGRNTDGTSGTYG